MFSDADMKKASDDIDAMATDLRAGVHSLMYNAINAFRPHFEITSDDLGIIDRFDRHIADLAEVLKQQRFREMVKMNAANVVPAPASRPGAKIIGEAPSQPHRFEPISEPPQADPWPPQQDPAPYPAPGSNLPTMPSGGGVSTFAGVLSAPPDDADSDIDRAVARNAGVNADDPDFAAAAAAFSDRVAPEQVLEETKVDPDFAHLHNEMARRTNEKA